MSIRIGSEYPSPPPIPPSGGFGLGKGPRRVTFKGKEVYFREPMGERLFENEGKWQDIQIPYENLANNSGIAERARNFMIGHMRRFQDRSESLRRKWLTIEHVLKGNSITRWTGLGSVHIPELYKMLETMVPRVEEAFFSFDPWFHVFGREEGDVEMEDQIRWFMESQLAQAQFPDYIQPFIRCMLIYGFASLKVTWRRKWAWRVERIGKRVQGRDGRFEYHYTKEEKRKIVYEGPEFHLIDPFDFLIDHNSTRPQDATFIGDVQWMTMSKLQELQEEGVYENIGKLAEQTPQRGWGTSDYYQLSRSLVWTDDRYIREPEGSDPRYKISEVWALFDLFGDGKARECVLTLGNESTVLRVQENPHDKKFRPYATARVVKEPFQFFGVAPFDHAVRLNMELDDHRNLALESHRLSVCPLVFVDSNADIPASIYNVEPGQVFRVNNPRDVQFTNIKMSVKDAQMITGELRRDIEETTGAPRIWEGSNEGGGTTATEVERKIQEGNRRLKASIRSVSGAFGDMLTIMHGMNAQYVTREQVYRVLGKRAKGLTVYDEIAPEVFQRDVDFEFQGVKGLQNLGLKATQLIQFTQTIAPLLPFLQGSINFQALGVDLYKALVNERPSDEIIEEMPSLNRMLSPDEENIMLVQGQKVEIHPMDDDKEHIEEHTGYVKTPDFAKLSTASQGNFFSHLAAHMSQKDQKTARKKAEANRAPAFPGMAPQNGEGGRGEIQPANPNYGGTGDGQPGQTPGVTPGTPNRPSATQTPGRDGQLYQTQQDTQAAS